LVQRDFTAPTAHLRDRLRALAAGLPVADPDSLAEHVLLAYDGTLSAFLRGASDDPLARGRALAATAVTHAKGHGVSAAVPSPASEHPRRS
jgi:hypothetical protein